MLDGGEWELEGELCADVGIQLSPGHSAGDEVSHVADVAVRLLHQCEVIANTIPATYTARQSIHIRGNILYILQFQKLIWYLMNANFVSHFTGK